MSTTENFKVLSVTKAVRGMGCGVVATSEHFEVYANRFRTGDKGRRVYAVTFSAIRIVSHEPRKIEQIEIPSTICSSLPKVIEFLKAKE